MCLKTIRKGPHVMRTSENKFHCSQWNPQGWDQVIWLRYKSQESTHEKLLWKGWPESVLFYVGSCITVCWSEICTKNSPKRSYFHPCLQLQYEEITKLFPILSNRLVNLHFLVGKFPLSTWGNYVTPAIKNQQDKQHILQNVSRNTGKDICLQKILVLLPSNVQ